MYNTITNAKHMWKKIANNVKTTSKISRSILAMPPGVGSHQPPRKSKGSGQGRKGLAGSVPTTGTFGAAIRRGENGPTFRGQK